MPDLRKDPITGRWVIISTARGKRPSSFMTAKREKTHIAICPFCPGNEQRTPPEIYALRPKEHTTPNSEGWQVRVLPNMFPALGIDGELEKKGIGMYDMMSGFGAHEVVVETPDHTKSTRDLSIDEISNIITICQDRIQDLYRDVRFRFVLMFKNEGEQAGASLEHSHSQLIATPVTPRRVKEELDGARHYYKQKERCVFCDIIDQEKDVGKRIVYENDAFIAFCPFASRFPFEIWLLPKKHEVDFYASRGHINDMARALKIVLLKLTRALDGPQYNYIVHTSPNRFPRRGYWHTIMEDYHWHIEIIPRILRTAGFEWGTGLYINPTPPEDAAKYLREITVTI
ncbi:MAG: galactose-1-phosphate uridylyltransferase [Candidatus Omnitrophota bacterium]